MKMNDKFIDKPCESCRLGVYRETSSEWWTCCDECNAFRFCYEPLPYQSAFHEDKSKYRMLAGGYGSGKSTTTVAEVIYHIMETPNGMTLMGAATLPQLENTSQKMFFEMLPEDFIENHSKQKNFVDLVNGHRVLFRPLDSEQKARSLNLTCFHIEESSEVDYEYFVQLQTRLRNHATKNHIGILSSNPSMGWIRTEFLLKSKYIYNSEVEYEQVPEEINSTFATHVAPTKLNIHLPPTFYEDTAKGKEDWWIRRYLEGSFENREGNVYPQAQDHIVDPFDIPRHWKIRVGGDFGIVDPTAFVFLATDPKDGITYVFDEHYESGKAVNYHAEKLNNRLDTFSVGRVERMVADSSGSTRNKEDMSSLFDHYAEYGIYWDSGTKKLEDSIQKVYGYFELGRLKVFSSCKNTLFELQNYKYPERSLDKNDKATEKPEDKFNHALDSLRYVVFEMPDDPDELINESYHYAETFTNSRLQEQDHLPHALRDDDAESMIDWTGY